MSNILKFTIILSLVYITKIFIDIPNSNIKNNDILIDSINYINWKNCINDSDGSDSSCLECDSIYNPNQNFIY